MSTDRTGMPLPRRIPEGVRQSLGLHEGPGYETVLQTELDALHNPEVHQVGLDADSVDGLHGVDLGRLAQENQWRTFNTFLSGSFKIKNISNGFSLSLTAENLTADRDLQGPNVDGTASVHTPGVPVTGEVVTWSGGDGLQSSVAATGLGLVNDVDHTGAGLEVNPTTGSVRVSLADDVAAIEALASTGIAVRTGANTWAQRQVTQPAAGIGITNPAGVAGDITLALANDLAALEGLASTGIAVRTATDTWAQRSIAGTADKITVTNGDGVSGNPTATIAATYAGQTSIVTLGAVTTGSWAATDIPVTAGGTGASTAADARTNLGLAIGSDVQAYDAELAAIAGLTSAADKVPYFTGIGTAAVADLPAYGRTLIANTTAGDARTDLGLVIGTDVQAYDAQLASLAGLAYTGNANKVVSVNAGETGFELTTPTVGTVTSVSGTTDRITSTGGATPVIDIAAGYVGQTSITTLGTIGTGTWNGTDVAVTAGGTGASTAGDARTNLGLAIGSDVQAYNANLAAIAGLTSAADKGIQFTGLGTAAVYDLTTAGKALLDDATAGDQRTTLGLGSLATASTISNANWSGDDLTVANGGTGVSTLPSAAILIGAGTSAVSSLGFTTGDALKVVRVNAGETAYELAAAAGGMGGSSGSTDNAVIRADGTGGSTVQSSGVIISDTNEISGLTNITIPNAGLLVLDTDASHTLRIKPGSNLTANKTLTLTTGDNNRTLDISAADVTVSAYGATLVDDADAATARSTLGLGTLATRNDISNDNWSGTDLSVANGGTGASTLTSGALLVGAGTSAVSALAAAAAGAIIYSSGAGVWTTLAAGTAGWLLKATGESAPAWEDPAAAVEDGIVNLAITEAELLSTDYFALYVGNDTSVKKVTLAQLATYLGL